MKKIWNILLTSLLLSSCSGMLDIDPHSAIPPGKTGNGDLSPMRMGMYGKVQNSPQRETYILFDIIGGNLRTGKTGNPRDLINTVLSPLNSLVSAGWNGCYQAIYQVNNVLETVERQPESSLRTTILGEAHYFRGYLYHLLVTRWGGVPIVTSATMEKLPRNSEQEVWDFIESELDKARTLLDKGISPYSCYYVSTNAVTALKARVKLERGKKEEAVALAEELISCGKYALDSFEKIFRGQANTEVIFSFSCLKEESNITLSTLFYTYAHPNKGSYIYVPSEEVMNMYEATDKRKDISVTIVKTDPCINKYPSGQTGTDPVIVSRLAEMYLVSAEGQGLPKGLQRLNELRQKRGLEAVQPKTEEDFMKCILDERRKELLAEGFRYYDLIRTGRAKSDLNLLDYQLKLPIPGKELILNPNLKPNPGY